MGKDAHSSKAVPVIVEREFFEARQGRQDSREIINPAGVYTFHAPAHSAPLKLKPSIPRACCDAVVYALKYAGTNCQIRLSALVAAFNVHSQRLHMTRHRGSAADAAVHIDYVLRLIKAMRRRMAPTKVAQIKHRWHPPDRNFARSSFVYESPCTTLGKY
jgi:hypothetical protein